MSISVNYYDKIVYVTSPTAAVKVQELVDAMRAAEDTVEGIQFGDPVKSVTSGFVDAEGLATLGGGFSTVITMTLDSNWYIEFWDGVSLGQVADGNVVGGKDGRPVRAALGSADTVLVLGAERGVVTAGGGGEADWQTAEKAQIRDALGVNGDKTTATGGQLQALPTTAEVNAEVDTALTNYDGPTKGELDTAVASLAIEANVETHAASALSTYDSPTRTEATADKNEVLTAMPDAAPTAAEVKTQADQALVDYDPPTKTELDSAESNIIDTLPDAADIDAQLSDTHGASSWEGDTADTIASEVWNRERSEHTEEGSFGATDEWASAIDEDALSSAVWSQTLPGNFNTGEAGQILGDNLDQVLSIMEHHITGGSSTLLDLSEQLDTVQADLNNPDQYKADVSGLSTTVNTMSSNIDTIKANINMKLSELQIIIQGAGESTLETISETLDNIVGSTIYRPKIRPGE